MKKLYLVLLVLAILLGGCAKSDHFIGTWENKTAAVPWIKIESDGEYYKVSSQITGPIRAIKKDGVLYISDCEFRQSVQYDSTKKKIVYCEKYYTKKL